MSRDQLHNSQVAVARCPVSKYLDEPGIVAVLRGLGQTLHWGNPAKGIFAEAIPDGAKVLVKPNFVLHRNQGNGAFEPVITHPTIVRAAVTEALRSRASEVRVGDAPIQSCDFNDLLTNTGLGPWATRLCEEDGRFKGIVDFRRTVCRVENGVRIAEEGKVELEHYVLFDLANDSLLEPITTAEPRFRITSYHPEFLFRTHRPGLHQYLIALEALEADVVINLPKLKMHKKAGVTNGLKNLVGINGNKEYLPHHRLGGSKEGGDCYPGRNWAKRTIERLYDFKNSSSSSLRSRIATQAMRPFSAILSWRGDRLGTEGSWSGNDTVWRMSLDLNRILLYGRTDGTMADEPQRKVLHLSDAVIAGQGNGPLSPESFELELLLASENPAALDYVGAALLGFDADQIPIVSRSFDEFRWPIAKFRPEEIAVTYEGKTTSDSIASLQLPHATHVPEGWTSAVLRERTVVGKL